MADLIISREAVEAAARALVDSGAVPGKKWADLGPSRKFRWCKRAEAALNAAAPLIVAAAFDQFAATLANNEQRDSHAQFAGLNQADIESINDAYDVVRKLLHQRAHNLRVQS